MPLLETSLRALFADRPLLDRVVRGIALDQGLSYLDALDALHKGVDDAYADGCPTMRGALGWSRSDPDYVDQAVRLLARREHEVQKAYERAAGPILLDEQTDPRGVVLLDQSGSDKALKAGWSERPSLSAGQMPSGGRGQPLTADIGTILTDPAEHERRLARMRKAQPGAWDGEEGRARFKAHDRLSAESGIDAVRTAERPRELAAARAQGERVAQQLDAAIAGAADKRRKLKQLDAQIEQLRTVPGVSFDSAREQVQARAAAAAQEPLKLLDQLESIGHAVNGEKPSTAGPMELDAQSLGEELERRRHLETPSQFLKTLEAAVAGEALPEHASPPKDEPETRPGVHPGSHELHERIRSRMRERHRPESEYVKTLEELL